MKQNSFLTGQKNRESAPGMRGIYIVALSQKLSYVRSDVTPIRTWFISFLLSFINVGCRPLLMFATCAIDGNASFPPNLHLLCVIHEGTLSQ